MATGGDIEHTELCTKIHDLLTQTSEDHHNAKPGSLSRKRFGTVIDALQTAEDAAHEACGTGV
jgi:hypothetical protein